MDPSRLERTEAYVRDVFGLEDTLLSSLMPRAIDRGLPPISVSSPVGHLLLTLSAATSRPRGLSLELGTLAGYSGIWLALGLAPGARLITVEPETLHADVAQANFAQAGVADRVEIRRTNALAAIARIARDHGPACLDLAFLDALKNEYPDYLEALRPLIRPGGMLIADNAISSRFHITDPPGDPMRDAVDRFNRTIAGDPAFHAACVPLGSGLVIATRTGHNPREATTS